MLCFHETPWPSASWKTACFLEMQCEVSAQTSLGVGGALDMLWKLHWPWHRRSPGCSSGSLFFSSQSLFIPGCEGTALGIIDISPKLPHSFIYLYLSWKHSILVYKDHVLICLHQSFDIKIKLVL